ncbi:MAG: hypothetical protein L3J17_08400 [Candidatus Jettenia sp.]|nr:MAG: hypothetical protein L3J17_08400 [Candidatus Jettenia sp.]
MHKPIISSCKVCRCTTLSILLWFLNQFVLTGCSSTERAATYRWVLPMGKEAKCLAIVVLSNLPGSLRDACSTDALGQLPD